MSASGTPFRNNRSRYSGGAIHCGRIGTLDTCVFETNRCVGPETQQGGAIHCDNGSNSDSMTNVQFVGNYAQATNSNTTYGGAVWGYAFGPFTNCEFRANYATGGNAYGGAIWCYGGNWTNCTFGSNSANTPAGTAQGGAVRIDAGYTNEASFTNCAFQNNNTDGNSTKGGAIYR